MAVVRTVCLPSAYFTVTSCVPSSKDWLIVELCRLLKALKTSACVVVPTIEMTVLEICAPVTSRLCSVDFENPLFTSGDVVLMVLRGGIGTILGPVVGAAVLISMQVYLASFGPWVMIIQGSIFIACILGFRRGLVGTLEHWLRRRNSGPATPEGAVAQERHWGPAVPDKRPTT